MNGILRFGVGHTSMLSTPEIAQFQLGDLTFKVHTLIGLSASRRKPPP
jgi:hypothetical protein